MPDGPGSVVPAVGTVPHKVLCRGASLVARGLSPGASLFRPPRHSYAGHPAEAVGREKQQRLTRLALAYLKRHELLEHAARFDVLAITWPETARKPKIEHIQNAFEAVGRGQMFS